MAELELYHLQTYKTSLVPVKIEFILMCTILGFVSEFDALYQHLSSHLLPCLLIANVHDYSYHITVC